MKRRKIRRRMTLFIMILSIACSQTNAFSGWTDSPSYVKAQKLLTKRKAKKKLKKLLKARGEYNPDLILECDSKDEKSFTFHYYDVVMDSPDSGHTATVGWYQVDRTNGKIIDAIFGEELN